MYLDLKCDSGTGHKTEKYWNKNLWIICEKNYIKLAPVIGQTNCYRRFLNKIFNISFGKV